MCIMKQEGWEGIRFKIKNLNIYFTLSETIVAIKIIKWGLPWWRSG